MSLYAQQPKMLHYTTENGISGTEVFDIIQDDRGYIWLATNNGICKFNGKSFESYSIKDGLSDNSVIEFYKDLTGKIWILTFNNKLGYLINDNIYHYKYNNKIKIKKNSKGYCFKSFSVYKNNVFIGLFNDAIIKITPSGIVDTLNSCSKPISVAYIQNKDEIVYSFNKPFEVNYKTHIFNKGAEYIIKLGAIMSKTTVAVSEMAKRNDNVAMSFGNNLFITNKSKILFEKEFKSDVTKLKYDKNNNLLVCTYCNGIYFFSQSNVGEKEKYHLLKDKTITSVFEDNDGGIWISTMSNGVFYISNLDFKYYNKETGLVDDFTVFIESGNDKVWFTTKNNYVAYLTNESTNYFDLSNINRYKISDICFDKCTNTVWGSFESGVTIMFRIKNNNITFFTTNEIGGSFYIKNKRKIITINNIFFTKKYFFVSHSTGINLLQRDNLKYKGYIDLRSFAIEYNKTNTIWIGNRNGLFSYKNDTITELGEKNKLFKKRVVKLKYEENNNALWVATKDTGIYVLFNDTLRQITEQDGMSSNNVTALFVKNNIIWAGTTNGLDQIKIKDYHCCPIKLFKSRKFN